MAGLLRHQVADLFGNLDDSGDLLVVAFLGAGDNLAALAAELDGQLFALRVADKLSGLLLVIPGRAGRLEVGPALLRSAAGATASTSSAISGRLSVSVALTAFPISGLVSGVSGQLILGISLRASGSADLLQRRVALLHRLRGRLLVERDLTLLLKVLFADLFRR